MNCKKKDIIFDDGTACHKVWKGWFHKFIITGILLITFVLIVPATIYASAVFSKDWTGTWAASPQAPSSTGISNDGFTNTTLRLIVHPHIDGTEVRIRLSNRFGKQPLTFNAVHIALQSFGANIVPDSDHSLTFNGGNPVVTVLPGAEALSDPVSMNVVHDVNLALSFYIAGDSGPATWHAIAQQTNYISTKGDHAADTQAGAFVNKVDSWFWLEEIEVLADSSTKGAIVTFGDSITDGVQSTPNENHRWPDYFADRIQKESPDFKLAVLNEGISGNRILTDTELFGSNALARLDKDVLLKNNVKAVIMLEGINDIGHGTFDAAKIIDGMKMFISRVHAKGIRIYGCTILPFAGAKYDTPEGQATRESVNNWIRTNSGFDGVIDFDKVIRDPANLSKLLPQYDSGDHLHPNDKGYQTMANTIDLHILKK